MYRIIAFFAAAIFISISPFTACSPRSAWSMDAVVDKVSLINHPDNIQLSFEIKNAFTEDIEEGIKSGMPATFTFFVELYRRRSLWFDEQIASLTFRHTIKYDTFKEEYEIVMEERSQNIVRVKELEQAKKIMAICDNIIVKAASAMKKGEKYQLKIQATLDAVNLPFPLNYMLFFVSFWNYETDWYEKEFSP